MNEDLLIEVIDDGLTKLKDLEAGSQEQSRQAESIVKLCSIALEKDKLDNEKAIKTYESELEEQKLDQEKRRIELDELKEIHAEKHFEAEQFNLQKESKQRQQEISNNKKRTIIEAAIPVLSIVAYGAVFMVSLAADVRGVRTGSMALKIMDNICKTRV